MKRLTRRNRRVLLVLLTDAENLSGWPIARAAQVPAGTTLPFLARLERYGYAASEWEPGAADEPVGRPRRRLYRLTPDGRAWAHDVLGLAPRGDAR